MRRGPRKSGYFIFNPEADRRDRLFPQRFFMKLKWNETKMCCMNADFGVLKVLILYRVKLTSSSFDYWLNLSSYLIRKTAANESITYNKYGIFETLGKRGPQIYSRKKSF